jgi:hypothetical protein
LAKPLWSGAGQRRQARQFVVRGHVFVDDRRLDIPSASVGEGVRIRIAPDSPVAPAAREAAADVGRVPAWLEADHEGPGRARPEDAAARGDRDAGCRAAGDRALHPALTSDFQTFVCCALTTIG